MSKCEKVKLSELIIQKTDTEQIVDMENEHYITLSLYGKGARERVIKDGKYPVPFTGYRVSRGQFIYSRIDARNGAYDIIGPELDGFVVSKDFPVFDINESKVLPHFLRRAVLSDAFINQVKNSSFGATNRMRIKEDIFEGYSIPLPGLSKQQEIVDILDRVETIINSRQQELEKLDDLIKARFAELFGDLKTVNTWKQEKISVVCNEIVDCVNKTAPVVDSVTPYKMLRTTNIRNGRVDVCNVKYVEEAAYKKWTRRSVPQRGDILLTREAPVGEVGVIDSDDKVFLGQRLVSYRVNPEKMDEVFLLYQMMSPFFQDELVGVAKGSTVKHIPVPVCTEFIVHVPPLELQKQFSGFVKQVDKSKLLEAQQAGFIAKTRPTNTILSIG